MKILKTLVFLTLACLCTGCAAFKGAAGDPALPTKVNQVAQAVDAVTGGSGLFTAIAGTIAAVLAIGGTAAGAKKMLSKVVPEAPKA